MIEMLICNRASLNDLWPKINWVLFNEIPNKFDCKHIHSGGCNFRFSCEKINNNRKRNEFSTRTRIHWICSTIIFFFFELLVCFVYFWFDFGCNASGILFTSDWNNWIYHQESKLIDCCCRLFLCVFYFFFFIFSLMLLFMILAQL